MNANLLGFYNEVSSLYDQLWHDTLLVKWWLHGGVHCGYLLTHWGQDKMATISQTTLSNAVSWMKMLEFWLKFHWSLFIRVQLIIFRHWFRWWLGAVHATSHYLNQWWLDYRLNYASLGLNELKQNKHVTMVPHCYHRKARKATI